MRTTTAHDLMLLALDDESGRPVLDDITLRALVGGAVLVDLVSMELLTIDDAGEKPRDRRVRATGRPVSDPVVAGILEQVDGKKTGSALEALSEQVWFAKHKRDLVRQVQEDLVASGDLQAVEDPVLGLFRRTRHLPTAGQSREARLREQILAALHSQFGPDPRSATVIALLSGADALHKVFPGEDRKELKRRGQEIAEGDWLAKGVRDAIAAMMAMVVISATAAV